MPGQAAYNSAKFAVRGFTEALRQELMLAGHPVKVTSCTPAASRPRSPATRPPPRASTLRRSTKFFDKRLASTSPATGGRIILEAVRKNKARVLVGPDAKVLDLIVRITGSGYQRLFAPVLGRMKPPSR